jgi:hypothetical protein
MERQDAAIIDAILGTVPAALPAPVAGNRLARLDPAGTRRAPERLKELTSKHHLLIEYMVDGCAHAAIAQQVGRKPFDPMTLIEAADVLRIRRRAARRLALDPLFRQAFAEVLRAWRESRAVDALRVVDAIMQDEGEGTAADRKVRLEAARVMASETLAPADKSPPPVNIGVTLQAGIVIRLPPDVAASPLERANPPTINGD